MTNHTEIDTPQVDDLLAGIDQGRNYPIANLARQLERALAAANAKVERYRVVLEHISAHAHSCDLTYKSLSTVANMADEALEDK